MESYAAMMRAVFVALVLAAVALVLAGLLQPAASGPRELKLAYVMAPGGPAHEAAERFAELAAEKTNGQVRIKLFPSAQLGNDRELAEGLMIGSVDMVLSGSAPIGWYLPEYGAVEVPFAFRDYAHMDRVLNGEIGREISQKFEAEKGIRIISWWHRGPRYLTTTDRKVTSPEDLKGLKLRVPELPTYIEAWRILGANPTPITYSEIFMALKQGVVAGQENPLEVIYTSSLYEVQKYVMKTEHLLGFYVLMVNAKVFDSLPAEHGRAILEAAAESAVLEHELMLKYDREFAEKLAEHGVQFVEVDREAFRRRVVEELPKKFEGQWAARFFDRIVETP